MQYRTLGDSDLKLSTVTFGAWAVGGWMWGGSDREQSIKAIQASVDYGVTSIDTAPIYGQGNSEEIVGEAIKRMPRDKVQILTKFGLRWDTHNGGFAFESLDNEGMPIKIHYYSGKESIIQECEDSLRRLNTDYIDLYQIHRPDSTTPIEESMEAVEKLMKDGKVRHAGVSNFNVEQMIEAEKHVHILSNQVPYSMVLRSIEKELIPHVQKTHQSIIAYSPLQRGLLSGKIKVGHKFAEGDHRATNAFFTEEMIKKTNAFLDKIRHIAEEKNATLAQLVIRWTVEQPGITIALVGARSAEQAIQNAKAMDIQLSKEELRFISAELKKADIEKKS